MSRDPQTSAWVRKTQDKYLREGRGVCKTCKREYDVVIPHRGTPLPGPQVIGQEPTRWAPRAPVIARHLHRIEEYGPKGASPTGFCPGSLLEADPVVTPERERGRRRP